MANPTQTKQTMHQDGRYVSVDWASGWSSLSKETIRRWLAMGRLTPYRPCRRVLVDLRELEAVIRGREVPDHA